MILCVLYKYFYLFTVLPDGFRFRQQTFDSLSNLFKWFKEHFRDPIPGTPMTPRGSNTQRTPYMTGTPGGGITPGAMSMANANTPYGGKKIKKINSPILLFYRVSNVDLIHFKELLWLRFWCQTFFPYHDTKNKAPLAQTHFLSKVNLHEKFGLLGLNWGYRSILKL